MMKNNAYGYQQQGAANALAGVIVGTGAQDNSPPAPGFLIAVNQRLEDSAGQLHELMLRLGSLADRLIGIQPKAVEGKGADPTTSGSMVGSLENSCNTLGVLVERCWDEIRRLERL